ncbi:MAG TPA: hypothetical protein VF933_16885, partial [Streptosporangiaceae bacterium]
AAVAAAAALTADAGPAGAVLAGAVLAGPGLAGGAAATSSDGGPAARVAARRGLRVRRWVVPGSPAAASLPPVSPALAVPVRPDGVPPPSLSPSRAVSSCCESFSSVSSIRAISRQAPGRVGSLGTLRSARELVVRARGERVGQRGRPRSQARCLYMFLRRARSGWVEPERRYPVRRGCRARGRPILGRPGGHMLPCGPGLGGYCLQRSLYQPGHQRW